MNLPFDPDSSLLGTLADHPEQMPVTLEEVIHSGTLGTSETANSPSAQSHLPSVRPAFLLPSSFPHATALGAGWVRTMET